MPRRFTAAFTLTELVLSIAILALVSGGVIYAFVNSTRVAEWNAYSLAGQSLAFQGVELARSAKWDPKAWPPVDELGVTNFVEVAILDVPIKKTPVYATNYVSVSWVSTNPPLRKLQADCVWRMPGRGLFTNTVITLRAPDQ
jgi:type II secretory pathway pseudopilin PulG